MDKKKISISTNKGTEFHKLGRIVLLVSVLCFFLDGLLINSTQAQESNDPNLAAISNNGNNFSKVGISVQQQLEESLEELAKLRDEIKNEKIPLSQKLSELEDELIEVRQEYQQVTRTLDSRTLDLTNLRSEIKSRNDEKTYLSNLLDQYIRNFETRLHISEIHRFLGFQNAGLYSI